MGRVYRSLLITDSWSATVFMVFTYKSIATGLFYYKKKKNHFVSIKTDVYDDHHMMFEITDNGLGMDQNTQRNIFEEFYSTKGSGGTGLGLAVVEKVVNKHGGRIEVSSKPGKGTRATIKLPIDSGENL